MEHPIALRLPGPLRRVPGPPQIVALPRRLRVALCALPIMLVLLGGGWLWFRDSPLVAVRDVQISGVQGGDAARVQSALTAAARGMSTLDVNVGALRAAVAPLRVVRSLSVHTSFPHGLRIDVVEQPPVAELVATGGPTAVAADGAVLGAGLLAGGLPSIHVGGLTPPPGGHVAGTTLRAQLSVLGAAPRMLLGWVQRVFEGPEGLTVTMHGGVDIYFGNATRARAKWLAAARVLADPRSAGATYVDVRLPERPAAGTSAPGGLQAANAGSGQVSASDPSSAALAATLDEAVAGSSGGVGTSAAAAPATGTGVSAAPGATSGSAAGSAAGEPASAGTGEPAAGSTGESASAGETAAGGATGTGAAAAGGEAASSAAAGGAGVGGGSVAAGGAATGGAGTAESGPPSG